ncbi:MAG: glycosyltransferase family 9 protein [Candidatus Altiarchaeota archaeon]
MQLIKPGAGRRVEDSYPLDLIDATKIKAVFYIPFGWSPESRLGDYVIQQPIVEGLRRRFPEATITVVTGSKLPFTRMDSVIAETGISDVGEKMKACGAGTLVVGRFEEGGTLQGMLERGGQALLLGMKGLTLFPPKSISGTVTFPYAISRLIERERTDSSIEMPSMPLLARAFMRDAGLQTPKAPSLSCEPSLVSLWECWVREKTASPRGDGLRVFYNNLQSSENLYCIRGEESSKLAANISNSSQVIFNPGFDAASCKESSRLVDETRRLGGNDSHLHIPGGAISQDDLAALMWCCDLVVTTNTGTMHAASALNRPLVLSYFITGGSMRQWIPENMTCFATEQNPRKIIEGYRALSLLSTGRGGEIFNDAAKAASDAKEYLGIFKGLDPIANLFPEIDLGRADGLFGELVHNVGPQYRGFFEVSGFPRRKNAVPAWHPYTQHPLYRYIELLADNAGALIPQDRIPHLK